MQIKLNIRRFDPEKGSRVHYEKFQVELDDSATVLDALINIREYQDQSLALRCSCRSAICGSCAMRINGGAKLACKTKATSVAPDGEEITVEPMGNQNVIRDLIVDLSMFWSKIRAVEPWLQPTGPEPEKEYIVPNQAMLDLTVAMNCIMCGACVSDCTSLEVDKNFLGPAALAKAYRFVFDPRDGHKKERLEKYSEYSGVWDCTHCYFCVQVCPKDVAPMERILNIREEAIKEGFTDNNGARHSASFARSVKHSGWLDEGRLAVESHGYTNIPELLSLLPVGFRAMQAGKMPSPMHHKRPGSKYVKQIFEKLEDK